MSWVKYAAIAVVAAFASFTSTAVVTSTEAEARCKGCNAPVVSRKTRKVYGGTSYRRSRSVRPGPATFAA